MPRVYPADPPDLAPRLDREAVLDEAARGLPNERERLARAIENQAYADLDYSAYDEKREGETEFDFLRRPKKQTGFLHQVLGRLCSHTYNPGPRRSAEDAALDELLQQVYEANHIDALMGEAERLSTVNDVAAIQVRWMGDRKPDRPIDLQLWGAEEFAVFESPDDPREPEAVVTIDRVDNTTRYRVWFADVVHSFSTAKAGASDGRRTEGAVIAYEEVGSPRPNPYGVLPFAFVPYRPQVRQFWVKGPGTFLRHSEATVNRQLSELAEAIVKYSCPVAYFRNVGPEFNPEIGPGRWLRLMRGGPSYGGDGYESSGEPEAGYLQANLEIEAIWHDARQSLDQAAEACDLPAAALRLDYVDAASGISIVCRAFPLIERARSRRPIYQRAEADLARLIGRINAAMTGAGPTPATAVRVLLSWPEPRIPIPGADRDQSDAWEISLGSKSRIQVIEERYSLTRAQAIAHLQQVAEDEREAAEILPQPEEAPQEPGPRMAAGDGRGGTQQEDDEDTEP